MSSSISIDDFRSTLRVIAPCDATDVDKVFTYWNNSGEDLDLDETLHLRCRNDGQCYLEIANVLYEGSLQVLEEFLYHWALDEGWFE